VCRSHLSPITEGVAIGALNIRRREVQPFTDEQVALLQTFADQAVIAIENVRLFNKTKEALEQQTATSEILRVISGSPTDVEPVFDTIVGAAITLCNAEVGNVTRFDGELVHMAAIHADLAGRDRLRLMYPARPSGTLASLRAIRDGTVVHIPDLLELEDAEFQGKEAAMAAGYRAVLSVPMLRNERAIGSLTIGRAAPGRFSDNQIALLQTFASQAVIATENVRLFKELERANRELSAASQHKSEFLVNMSHEQRTPLNAIIGFSEVLSERMFGDLNEKQEEYLKDIHASGQHLLSLINDILDLSKIEAGRMELELTDFDLPTALDSALMLVRERAGRRSITLQTSVDEQPGAMRADERKIRQVVLNLLSNAIKFTPEGGRTEVALRTWSGPSRRRTFRRCSTSENRAATWSTRGSPDGSDVPGLAVVFRWAWGRAPKEGSHADDKGLAGYVLHDGDGTFGHERAGHRMGAHTVACDAASGVGSAEEGRTR
jgi:signal transduction histidine kinase